MLYFVYRLRSAEKVSFGVVKGYSSACIPTGAVMVKVFQKKSQADQQVAKLRDSEQRFQSGLSGIRERGVAYNDLKALRFF